MRDRPFGDRAFFILIHICPAAELDYALSNDAPQL